jgi:flavorubredoxin/flavin reductase (DIM6/NTAB) family NADH-FMN oxidoreductase RutF
LRNFRSINSDVYWVGANNKRQDLFEGAFPLPSGVSYNSYLVLDEKNILLDCVDKSACGAFFENLDYLLKDKKLDFVVINHCEPDHLATLDELVLRFPEVKIIGNTQIIKMIKQFFDFDVDSRAVLVEEGDIISTGKHEFVFYFAPMVHWPEVMMTYDKTDKYLYSADAFGTFGTLNGNIFADECDFERDFLSEARRYYTNIVGKYGAQVQAALKKAATLDISAILPLHGPVWRKNLGYILDKYQKWSTYTPEEEGVLIAYASVYGGTENAANILATKLAENGVKKIAMFDVSVTHPSFVLSEAFRLSHIVFAATTYNAGIFVSMETLLHDIAAHNLQNRTIAIIENGSWAAQSGQKMKEILSKLNEIKFLETTISLKSSVKEENLLQLQNLADEIVNSLPKNTQNSVQNPFTKITYGLFVLTARDGEKDGGCIINTVMQITDNPKRIEIAVNKSNFTHDLIVKSGKFNVSVLTTESKFDVFKRFGFQSGRNINKFAEFEQNSKRDGNNLYYITQDTNAYFSGKVISTSDFGTHSVFVADVEEAVVLSSIPSLSYQYYFDNIKPKPEIKPAANRKKYVYICKICGYIYESDEEMPDDYICPLCKHGKADFELKN